MKHIPVPEESLKEIIKTSSEIIQKTSEAEGTLNMIDSALEENEENFQSDMLWAIRNAIRNISSASADALDIIEKIETFEEIK